MPQQLTESVPSDFWCGVDVKPNKPIKKLINMGLEPEIFNFYKQGYDQHTSQMAAVLTTYARAFSEGRRRTIRAVSFRSRAQRTYVGVRLELDVVEFYQQPGRGRERRMEDVLRSFMVAQKA